MRSDSSLSVREIEEMQSNSLTILLLNIRPLNSHLVDLSNSKRHLESDIMCLTGTQQPLLSQFSLIVQLPAFDMKFNNRGDKF